MLAIRLDKKTDARLARLARQAGRTKTAYAREALLEHVQDLADAKLALARLVKPAKIYSSIEVKRALGL
jgi:RHH-type rel operon transcriptional repressor/antitoxin RelB